MRKENENLLSHQVVKEFFKSFIFFVVEGTSHNPLLVFFFHFFLEARFVQSSTVTYFFIVNFYSFYADIFLPSAL